MKRIGRALDVIWHGWVRFDTETVAVDFAFEHRCGWAREIGFPGCGGLIDPIHIEGVGWLVPRLCCRCADCKFEHPVPPESTPADAAGDAKVAA